MQVDLASTWPALLLMDRSSNSQVFTVIREIGNAHNAQVFKVSKQQEWNPNRIAATNPAEPRFASHVHLQCFMAVPNSRGKVQV